MKEESTNVELESVTIVGGEVVADLTKGTTTIPPEGKLKKNSPGKEGTVAIKLSGKWPPREAAKKGKGEAR